MRKASLMLVVLPGLLLGSSRFGCRAEKQVVSEAITLDGKRVVLYTNGTWEFDTPTDPNEVLFRQIPWGATEETVRSAMKMTPSSEQQDVLIYRDSIGAYPVSCIFFFANGHLVSGRNDFDEVYNFDAIEALLVKKYGEPAEHHKDFADFLNEDARNDLGFALAAGGVTIHSQWKLGEVTIRHELGSRGDSGVVHDIGYRHEEMSVIENALREEQALRKL